MRGYFFVFAFLARLLTLESLMKSEPYVRGSPSESTSSIGAESETQEDEATLLSAS